MKQNRGLMNKNPIRGDVKQGEPASHGKAFVAKAKRRISGSRAVKDCVLTWGDLALMSERAAIVSRKREVSRGHSSRKAKG